MLNGLNSNKNRSKEAQRIVKIGFNQFKNIEIANQGDLLRDVPVWSGKKKVVELYTKERISITIPKSLQKSINYKIRYESPLFAPLEKDSHVGDFLIRKNNEIIKIYKLYTNNEVKKLNFFSKIILNFKFLLFGESLITE